MQHAPGFLNLVNDAKKHVREIDIEGYKEMLSTGRQHVLVEADAVVKGQTASSSFKPAILDNGVRVMVPPHIGAGTRILVDVYERTYVGKVN